jgi:PAS domain S-box-containing protein
MINLNSRLQQQLKKYFGPLENIPENLQAILNVVSDTYDEHDKDRKMLEHSIELNSAEMKQLDIRLRKEAEANNKIIYGKLKESLTLLNEDSEELTNDGSDYRKLSRIADLLKKEIIKRKNAEEKRAIKEQHLIHANRISMVVSQINQMIVRVENEYELYKEACHIAIELGKFKGAWIDLANEDDPKRQVVESYGVKESELSELVAMTTVPWHQVIHTKTFCVRNSINAEPHLHNRKSLAARGYGSYMIIPITKSGTIVGAFNLFAEETDFFNSAEIELLKEATDDISFALNVFEKGRLRTIAEQKLRTSELRLNQAQAIAHFGSWFVDFSTGVSLWSEEALRIYGLNPDESRQSYESWISFIHPEDLDYVLKVIKENELSLSNSSFFHRIVRKDGIVRYLYSQASFEFGPEGKPIGLYGATHDVTEVKEAERALLESESNLQAIFENTSDGFILTDLRGFVKSFNTKAKEIIIQNTQRNINIGDSIYDFVHPSRKNIYKNAISNVLGGDALRYEYPYKRKNGAIEWFEFTINPVYQSGTITGLSITSSDITVRKLAELSIVESEKRYSELFQLSPLPKWVYDRKTLRFLEVNQAAIDHYGYTRDEFLTMTIKDIRPPEDIALLEAALKKSKNQETPSYYKTVRHQKKNGNEIQVELQSNHIQYKRKKATIVVAHDITESLNYIKAIEEQNRKLREISWMQSHVIRAPLARIMALAPMICNKEGTPEDKKLMIEYLQYSANELDEVIRNIIDTTATVDIKNIPLKDH